MDSAIFGFVALIFIIVLVVSNQIQRQTARVTQLEVMLTALLDNAGIDFDPDEVVTQKVVEALSRGNKIQAIKRHREITGSGLRDAKEFVEKIQRATDSET